MSTTLSGIFVSNSDVSHVWPLFNIHATEQRSSETVVVNLLSAQFQQVVGCAYLGAECVLTGRFVTLRASMAIRVFEAFRVEVLVAAPLAAVSSSSSESPRAICGSIDCLSEPIRIQEGLMVFCGIRTSDLGSPAQIALSKEALRVVPYLVVGQKVTILGGKNISWRASGGASSEQLSGRWRLVVHACDVRLGKVENHSCLRRPVSYELCTLDGKVHKVRPGWLFLSLRDGQQLVRVVFHPRRGTDTHPHWFSLCAGAKVSFRHLVPVVLYGTVQGYACTARTSMEVKGFAPVSSPSAWEMIPYAPAYLQGVSRVVACWRSIALPRISSILSCGESWSICDLVAQKLLFFLRQRFVACSPLFEAERDVQREFVDSWYADWKVCRGELDCDFASSLLRPVDPPGKCLDKAQGFINRTPRGSLTVPLDFSLLLPSAVECDGSLVVGVVAEVACLHGVLCLRLRVTLDTDVTVSVLVAGTEDIDHGPMGLIRAARAQHVSNETNVRTVAVLLHPRLVIEDQPWASHEDFHLFLVVCQRDLALLQLRPRLCEQQELLPEVELAEVPVCASVRSLLVTSLSPGSTRAVDGWVEGLVVHKQLLLDDFNNRADASRKRKTGVEADTMASKKVGVTLRDCVYADSIAVYIPGPQAAGLLVGMTVRVRNVAISNPHTNRKLYLRTLGIPAEIEIIDMAGLETVKVLSGASQRLPLRAALSGAPPPLTSMRYLYQARSHDRRVFRVVGSVSFVRKLHVVLRCVDCSRAAVPHVASYISAAAPRLVCPSCRRTQALEPQADCSISLDDGSAEAVVRLEGSDVFDLLRWANATRDRQGKAVLELQKALELEAWRSGRFSYDHIDMLQQRLSRANGEKMEADWGQDLLELFGDDIEQPPTANAVGLAALLAGKFIKQPQDALQALLSTTDYTCPIEVVVRVDMYKSKQSRSSGGGSSISNESSRLVRMQEVDPERRYLVQHRQCRTLLQPRLELTGSAVRGLLGRHSLVDVSRELLSELEAS